MDIAPFELERFFARYEHGNLMLAESGVRSLPASEFDLDAGDLGYVIPTAGDPELRERVGIGYDRSAEEVLFTCGTQEANFLVFAALLGADDHAVVVTPTYQSLSAVPASFAEVTRVPLSEPDWELDVDRVLEAMRPETRLVVLASPNNPTGRYHEESTVRALYEAVTDRGVDLLCDEVYRLLAPDPRPPVASYGPGAISTAGLSKAYGLAGLRFGWLAGSSSLVEAAARWKDYTTISPPAVGQHVARQVLGTGRGERILERNRRHARTNREITRSHLERWGCSWYEGVGVNVFPTVPEPFETGRAFCERLVEAEGVVLAPGEAFGHPGRFRLGFGLPTDELEEGLVRIDRFLERV